MALSLDLNTIKDLIEIIHIKNFFGLVETLFVPRQCYYFDIISFELLMLRLCHKRYLFDDVFMNEIILRLYACDNGICHIIIYFLNVCLSF